MSKIVTICGSMRFMQQMMDIAYSLETKCGYIVIQCAYPTENTVVGEKDLTILDKLHLEKIKISDAIYVVNVGGYIGESTRREIEYAKSLNKEIMYLEAIQDTLS